MAEAGAAGVRHAAVLGRPVAHSLSPVLHTAAYRELGLPWVYTAIDCGIADLAGVLGERSDWGGFSLTMPLKRAGLEIAAQVAPGAALVGAANTLLPVEGGWRADNTDVAGVSGALGESAVGPTSLTVLGAGGTAQAVVAAASGLGLGEVAVLVRDVSRTTELRETADRCGVQISVGVLDTGAPALRAHFVVSTLPAGAADPIGAAHWREHQVVLDAVYAGWPTRLAAAAAAAGATVLSGALMLLHQAMAQVELMTGMPAPAEAMRAALRKAAPSSGV